MVSTRRLTCNNIILERVSTGDGTGMCQLANQLKSSMKDKQGNQQTKSRTTKKPDLGATD